ncbi:protein tyrosine phosphatase [Sinomonas sp. JGH33]|uniref:Protein tyrosine phosphatase n=1 Tax=Sinomonas terricola TaxID=3110330 RepID=A0ABU5TA16_9MICC|nr:protein tyrosine phosphatase [Sinomonas sp. JGH33]MEA5456359.1 protein tyrosine phosphatase [Sinomonas sp. JGH33]
MSFFSVIASSKLAASALAVGALAVGGAGTAAYANALPAPAQQAAHDLIGAPSPSVPSALAKGTATADKAAGEAASAGPSAPAVPSSPVSLPSTPDLSGVSLADLCQTFVHGGLTAGSAGLKDLTAAAHGEANITSFCAATLESGAAAGSGSAQVGANVSASADGSALPAAPSVPAVPSPAVPSPAAGIADDATNALHK